MRRCRGIFDASRGWQHSTKGHGVFTKITEGVLHDTSPQPKIAYYIVYMIFGVGSRYTNRRDQSTHRHQSSSRNIQRFKHISAHGYTRKSLTDNIIVLRQTIFAGGLCFSILSSILLADAPVDMYARAATVLEVHQRLIVRVSQADLREHRIQCIKRARVTFVNEIIEIGTSEAWVCFLY